MKTRRLTGAAFAVASAVMLMGASDGRWLDRVSAKDHARGNPLVRTPELRQEAAGAGAQVYRTECAKCHGVDGRGLYSRPPVIGRHVADASDGDLFWLMENGVPWKGMPPWMMLPETQRWQLVTYLRSLNTESPASPDARATATAVKGVSR